MGTPTRATTDDRNVPAGTGIAWFVAITGGWTAFGVVLVSDQSALSELLGDVRDLPLFVELVIWFAAFPFMLGLLVWDSGMDEAVRYVLVALVALLWTYWFRPRRRPADAGLTSR